jgi:hypothetical protein
MNQLHMLPHYWPTAPATTASANGADRTIASKMANTNITVRSMQPDTLPFSLSSMS